MWFLSAIKLPMVFQFGPALPLGPLGELSWSGCVDALSLVMFALVALIGTVIVRFSRVYLAGERGRLRYFGWLALTLAAIVLLIVANNLPLLALAWTVTSLCLHQLLTFYPERPAALLAAHKKFLLSRAADILMLLSIAAIHTTLGTVQIDQLAARMATLPTPAAWPIQMAAVMLALTAILKCAQLPFHGWLIQVMEAPTPVSALLHAGIVNIGGFVLIRLAPIVGNVPLAQTLLVVVGGLTAWGAGLVMTTRISIKVALAWSTCAQMGFMLLECGLGAYALALLHLLAHSLYKAHAFLSAGGTVLQHRLSQQLPDPPPPRSIVLGSGLGPMVLLTMLGCGYLLHAMPADYPVEYLFASIFGLALSSLMGTVGKIKPAQQRAYLLMVAMGLALSYAAAHWLFEHIGLPQTRPGTPQMMLAACLLFGLYVSQLILALAPHGRFAQWLYPHAFAGFHLDERFTHLTLQWWPVKWPVPSPPPPPTLPAAIGPKIVAPKPSWDAAFLQQALDKACARIAPSWPLDAFIAVNPYWGFVHQPIEQVASLLQRWMGSPMLMPSVWYRQQWQQGQIDSEILARIMAERNEIGSPEAWINERLAAPEPASMRWLTFTEIIDAHLDLRHKPAFTNLVTHAIGQYCGAYFDQGQARWQPAKLPFYAGWRATAATDEAPSILSGVAGIARTMATLPSDADALIAAASVAMQINPDEYEAYFTTLLLSINGWAAFCAYKGWQAKLAGQQDHHLKQLLAIRLGWEWALFQCVDDPKVHESWQANRYHVTHASTSDTSHMAWIAQSALEATYQARIHACLSQAATTAVAARKLYAQATFCIDVRSEVIRRHLEKSSDGQVQTIGFAGFFGLPIAYTPLGSECSRPQLPGLLAPRLQAAECASTPAEGMALATQRRFTLSLAQAWQRFKTSAFSCFAFVESFGLFYAWKLLKDSFCGNAVPSSERMGLSPQKWQRLRPELIDIPVAQAVECVAGILKAMSLTRDFAPVVLLIGHGSSSTNNPHAAGLDCGACCGQSGEINARVLATLLSDDEVRRGLQAHAIDIPPTTRFVAGLHNTTTDDIQLFDLPSDKTVLGETWPQLETWLSNASASARRERAAALDLEQDEPRALAAALQRRSVDWAQVRPEWGLANNAGFVAAPRRRTQHINLAGRCFLHEYYFEQDQDGKILELIMTAPLIVAHWINMQYYASTVDPVRFGSGNKVLHNVVGGHIGVFEGNGGDLRIGLPWQSVHNGTAYMHTPQRLSAWIEAPTAAIAAVVARHPLLQQLIGNGWLYLFCIVPDKPAILRYDAHGSAGEKSPWQVCGSFPA